MNGNCRIKRSERGVDHAKGMRQGVRRKKMSN